MPEPRRAPRRPRTTVGGGFETRSDPYVGLTYSGDLRGLTHGQGELEMEHDHHAVLPGHLQPFGSEAASPATR